jgi:hypothetical protein
VGAGGRLLHRLLAARCRHQPWTLGPLGHLRPSRRRRRLRGHLLGQLFQAPFWTLTARQGADLVQGQLLAPLAIVAFVLGRELTIWFGAWVAARGKRVTELNDEAQREYERTLEAGPRLHQS